VVSNKAYKTDDCGLIIYKSK